jgi:oligopeptide transport system permease protein
VSGFIGGWVDELMMRVVDVLYSLPSLFFIVLLMVVFGSNIILIFVAIGAVDWLAMARIVRGQTVSLRTQPFIEAAQISGATRWQIIARHVIPNVSGPVVVYTTLSIPAFILAESFLSFLGLGVQEPMTSLGLLVADGAAEIETAPWMLLVPAIFLTTILYCFNFVGDALRDALDPRSRR